MPPAAVNQTLHGYDDGHRLISGSIPLSSADARTMLVMSDLSGPGVKPSPSGYLTGYPLDGAGKYVLARTWGAPEMPRPGCVWTHSLIIDNADLATLKSLTGLLSLYQRPLTSTARLAYVSPIPLPLLEFDEVPANADERIESIANALYSYPTATVLGVAGRSDDDEGLVAKLWLQQFPRLRRAFGFCTLSGADRTTKAGSLDLQLVANGDRQTRSRFPGAIISDEAPRSQVLDPLLRDLTAPRDSQFREFLRRAGGDVDGGRGAMLPLCRIYTSVFEPSHPDLSGAVAAFRELGSNTKRQARSLRSIVAKMAIDSVETVSDDVFEFLVEALAQEAAAPNQHVLGVRFGAALWKRSPTRFVDAISEQGVIGQAAEEALPSLSVGELIAGLEQSPHLVPAIAEQRQDLLGAARFWKLPTAHDDLARSVRSDTAAAVAGALIDAGRSGPAPLVIEVADPGDLARVLERNSVEGDVRGFWLQALSWNLNKAAAVLASGQVRSNATLVSLARSLDPDQLPNDYGDDPWAIGLRSATGFLDTGDHDYLAAFIMSRALGSRSRSRAELFRYSYTTVFHAFQATRLSPSIERLVAWRLDWAGWLEWDKCARLRQSVVARFVDSGLDPAIFGRLTDDGKMAIALIDEAARTSRGRRYLADVRRTLKNDSDKGLRVRADYIGKKIN